MNLITYFLTIFFVAATLIPFIKHDVWWVRVFEFPRLQLIVIGCVSLIFISFSNLPSVNHAICVILNFGAIFFQGLKIMPFTEIYPTQIITSKDTSPAISIKLVIANVFMQNANYQSLASIINEVRPDILLAVEVDRKWCDSLNELIEFKYKVIRPLDNTYGMALYSQLKLSNTEIRYLVESDVPSIYAQVNFPSGLALDLYCLHPKPPAPQESKSTTKRDAELLIVGREVKDRNEPTLVMGDLNDVAWSYTTTLFQKVSGLLDPRIGRGMFNSFNAKLAWLRFPLDHAFASEHFKLVTIKRLPKFGSDHFPIMLEFSIESDAINKNDTMDISKNDRKLVEEKIEAGL